MGSGLSTVDLSITRHHAPHYVSSTRSIELDELQQGYIWDLKSTAKETCVIYYDDVAIPTPRDSHRLRTGGDAARARRSRGPPADIDDIPLSPFSASHHPILQQLAFPSSTPFSIVSYSHVALSPGDDYVLPSFLLERCMRSQQI